ncbi:MAG: hypothetical protein HOP10_11050 [Chitinophagaceae bacterium]|nr:hypothetical protein [Chitinophagaceae bacterium]
MKRILKTVAFSLLLVSGTLLQNTATAQSDYYNEDREVSYQTFYDELSPHGQWVDYPNHGYVWIPDAGPDFRPYSTNGHWVWTDNYEWMWVSDYDWGWAPFHYGRWDYDSHYGWYWVPGYEWSSAWVAWRDGGDYYGWAPIRPGISININFNIGGYSPPNDFWCFTPRRYINSPRIYDYYVPRHNNVTIINQTTIIINNYNYGGSYGFRSGPRRYDAERYCGRINPVRFRDSYNPGRTIFRNNEVSVYRPRVRQDNDRQYSPRSFERYDRNSNTGFRNRDNNQGQNNNNGTTDNRRFDRRDDQQQNNNGTVDNNRRSDRRNADVNQQDNNNGNNNSTDRRRFDRNDNTTNGNRERQPIERRVEPREQPQNNNGNGSTERRRFDRSTDQPQRQPQQIERRQQPQSTERRFERPQQQQVERRQQPQSTERRVEPRPQQQQQVERRQQQPQPQQQRQIERRDNGNRQQSSTNNGNGNGNGRRRF